MLQFSSEWGLVLLLFPYKAPPAEFLSHTSESSVLTPSDTPEQTGQCSSYHPLLLPICPHSTAPTQKLPFLISMFSKAQRGASYVLLAT